MLWKSRWWDVSSTPDDDWCHENIGILLFFFWLIWSTVDNSSNTGVFNFTVLSQRGDWLIQTQFYQLFLIKTSFIRKVCSKCAQDEYHRNITQEYGWSFNILSHFAFFIPPSAIWNAVSACICHASLLCVHIYSMPAAMMHLSLFSFIVNWLKPVLFETILSNLTASNITPTISNQACCMVLL